MQLFRGERRPSAEVLGRAGHQGQVASIRPATRPPGSAGGVTEEGKNSIDVEPELPLFALADSGARNGMQVKKEKRRCQLFGKQCCL